MYAEIQNRSFAIARMIKLITPLLDIGEEARLLRVKKSTLHKWVCYKKIPYLKIRRRTLFHREELEKWIAEQNK